MRYWIIPICLLFLGIGFGIWGAMTEGVKGLFIVLIGLLFIFISKVLVEIKDEADSN